MFTSASPVAPLLFLFLLLAPAHGSRERHQQSDVHQISARHISDTKPRSEATSTGAPSKEAPHPPAPQPSGTPAIGGALGHIFGAALGSVNPFGAPSGGNNKKFMHSDPSIGLAQHADLLESLGFGGSVQSNQNRVSSPDTEVPKEDTPVRVSPQDFDKLDDGVHHIILDGDANDLSTLGEVISTKTFKNGANGGIIRHTIIDGGFIDEETGLDIEDHGASLHTNEIKIEQEKPEIPKRDSFTHDRHNVRFGERRKPSLSEEPSKFEPNDVHLPNRFHSNGERGNHPNKNDSNKKESEKIDPETEAALENIHEEFHSALLERLRQPKLPLQQHALPGKNTNTDPPRFDKQNSLKKQQENKNFEINPSSELHSHSIHPKDSLKRPLKQLSSHVPSSLHHNKFSSFKNQPSDNAHSKLTGTTTASTEEKFNRPIFKQHEVINSKFSTNKKPSFHQHNIKIDNKHHVSSHFSHSSSKPHDEIRHSSPNRNKPKHHAVSSKQHQNANVNSHASSHHTQSGFGHSVFKSHHNRGNVRNESHKRKQVKTPSVKHTPHPHNLPFGFEHPVLNEYHNFPPYSQHGNPKSHSKQKTPKLPAHPHRNIHTNKRHPVSHSNSQTFAFKHSAATKPSNAEPQSNERYAFAHQTHAGFNTQFDKSGRKTKHQLKKPNNANHAKQQQNYVNNLYNHHISSHNNHKKNGAEQYAYRSHARKSQEKRKPGQKLEDVKFHFRIQKPQSNLKKGRKSVKPKSNVEIQILKQRARFSTSKPIHQTAFKNDRNLVQTSIKQGVSTVSHSNDQQAHHHPSRPEPSQQHNLHISFENSSNKKDRGDVLTSSYSVEEPLQKINHEDYSFKPNDHGYVSHQLALNKPTHETKAPPSHEKVQHYYVPTKQFVHSDFEHSTKENEKIHPIKLHAHKSQIDSNGFRGISPGSRFSTVGYKPHSGSTAHSTGHTDTHHNPLKTTVVKGESIKISSVDSDPYVITYGTFFDKVPFISVSTEFSDLGTYDGKLEHTLDEPIEIKYKPETSGYGAYGSHSFRHATLDSIKNSAIKEDHGTLIYKGTSKPQQVQKYAHLHNEKKNVFVNHTPGNPFGSRHHR